MQFQDLIVIRGGGDLATGVAQKFCRAGFPLLVLEMEKPTAIRRSVALSEAVYNGFVQVEDVHCRKIDSIGEIKACHQKGEVPVFIDPAGECIAMLSPAAVIDAVMAKRNLGTNRGMAPVTIALGPGFRAGEDVDAVIETMRGHDLGRLILSGSAQENTGVPGEINGQSDLRVLKAPVEGEVFYLLRQIGDMVREGEILFKVCDEAVKAPIGGVLRGMIRSGLHVREGMKVGDIDPRPEVDWRTISDKARCLGGAALEAYFYLKGRW